MRAHRLAWMIYHGPLTSKQHVLHKCDNPLCVNPDHLFIGNQRENMADMKAKGRQTKGEAHGQAKLTETQVIAIRTDHRKQAEIASDYNISVPTVSDIKRRYSWKHL